MTVAKSPNGMREIRPDVWEVIVEAGRDPVTGKRHQVSRRIRGGRRAAIAARAELMVEVSKGQHDGTNATVDVLFDEWIIELRRKGRSPNTISGYEKVYEHNIRQRFGKTRVRDVQTKLLSEHYGAHSKRGLSPASVYQIHAVLSSMFTQACRWGWRDSNPTSFASPPQRSNLVPVVPSAQDVVTLMREAASSRRPEMARLIWIAATTGMRRAELCGLRMFGDIDEATGELTIARSVAVLKAEGLTEIPTKNRRTRVIALDTRTLDVVREQIEMMRARANEFGVEFVPHAFLFSNDLDGATPLRPDAVTQFFNRMRVRVNLEHIDFHGLRKFMSTYGQELGFPTAQVALRAGHDPSVAARHYTGKVSETDRRLASSIADLLAD